MLLAVAWCMNLEEVLHVFRTDEDKAKLLAMQIANDRGREVLECIFGGKAKSATEIARELETPLPTVMFHIERFLEIGIIKVVRTRKSKKLREIKYYGPAKQAILIIPFQKEETISTITKAVRATVITPVTALVVLAAGGLAGYVIHRVTAPPPPLEVPMLAAEKASGVAPTYAEKLVFLQNPVLLVILGCVLTLSILLAYSLLKK